MINDSHWQELRSLRSEAWEEVGVPGILSTEESGGCCQSSPHSEDLGETEACAMCGR